MAEGWPGLVVHTDGSRVFSCPEVMCYYHVLLGPHTTQEHNCPHIGPSTYGWSITVGLVEEIWQRLDERIDTIKDPQASPVAVEEAKSQASAYADTLTLFMKPLFSTVTEISREGLKRWKARQSGDLDYQTPGISHAKYKTMMDGDVWYKTASGGWTSDPRAAAGEPTLTDEAILNRTRGIVAVAIETSPLRIGGAHPLKSMEELKAQEQVKHHFTDEEVQKLKTFHENGFAETDLARIHGVSVATIRAALSI